MPHDAPTFENANLSGATFRDVRLAGACFDDVNLSGAHFHNINLSNTRFDDVNWSHVAITNACLHGMTINGILVTDLLAAYKNSNP